MRHVMILFASLAILACTVLSINAGPVATDNALLDGVKLLTLDDVEKSETFQPASDSVKMPRFTCDILSAGVKGIQVDSAACAAKCLGQRHLGGSCKNGICECSQKTF